MNLDWNKISFPKNSTVLSTCDMHTAGEPLRIVIDGYPGLVGSNLLEKREYALQHLDRFRRLLMFEPRGHYDMYGAVITEPDDPQQADVGVLFLHNEGYSTMCGHAVIALGRFLVDQGVVARTPPETIVRIQCPCGVVKAFVECDAASTGRVRFHSVPAFAHTTDEEVHIAKLGLSVKLDVAFGGAFYAILPASRLELDVRRSSVKDLVDAATAVSEAVQNQVKLSHPESPKLAFLYGTILTDDNDGTSDNPTANICVFAKAEVDRSPTGSGVTARVALHYSKGQIKLGDKERVFESILGSRSTMTGKAVSEVKLANGQPCVTVEVSGMAHYMGLNKFILEEDDPFPEGFLLR